MKYSLRSLMTMFRFSIRELMILTLAIILGVAWFADHRRWLAASADATKVKVECKLAKEDVERLERYIDGINQRLQTEHKLQLVWVTGGGRESLVDVRRLRP